jgi:5-methylcytosine-specific restriction endonuclease McrA
MYDRKVADARYRKRHKKEYNARIKKWKADHPERAKAQRKKYKLKHKLEIKIKNAQYRKRKEKERKEYNAKYYKAHKKEYKRRLNRWRRENPERATAQLHKRRALRSRAGGSYTKEEWRALKQRYGSKCLRCKRKRRLTPDHVVPIAKGGTSNIDNIQPLCQPCNSQKGTKITDYRRDTRNSAGVPFVLEERLRRDSE